MIHLSIRVGALTAVLGGVVLCGGLAAQAAPFDGPWSVTISTSRGDCGSNSLYGVVIANGLVRYAGGAGVAMSGRVSNNGSVSVSVRQGENHAAGSGKLYANGTGRGSWSGGGPTGRCAGSWSAQRSG
jgi:hypothetical protein